jgi:hypothetical protein
VIWQVVRLLHFLGVDPEHGRIHRNFWYWPLLPVLSRAGLAEKSPAEEALAATRGHRGR